MLPHLEIQLITICVNFDHKTDYSFVNYSRLGCNPLRPITKKILCVTIPYGYLIQKSTRIPKETAVGSPSTLFSYNEGRCGPSLPAEGLRGVVAPASAFRHESNVPKEPGP